jgi:hypothetical protein
MTVVSSSLVRSSFIMQLDEGVRLSLLKLVFVEFFDFPLDSRTGIEVIRVRRILQLPFQVGEFLTFFFISSNQLRQPSSFREVLILATTLFKLAGGMMEESGTVVRRG